MTGDFRCSAASLESTETLEGTASTVRSFLLLENPGPWGVHAVREARLPDEVRARLAALERTGLRPLLVRRPRRSGAGGYRLFGARVAGPEPSVGRALLDDPRDLLDLDLEGLVAGGTAGLEPHLDPLFLVCTHGRHDACCAELGRPLAAALSDAAPEETWEVSHIGGDRFAPNVLVLPQGLYYGRLLPAEAPEFVETHRSGRLDLEHLRGRSSYPFAVQAAEVHLRRRLDHQAAQPMSLVSLARDGDVTTVVFGVHGEQWRVRVETHRAAPARLTCRSTDPSPAPIHNLLGIDRVTRSDGPSSVA